MIVLKKAINKLFSHYYSQIIRFNALWEPMELFEEGINMNVHELAMQFVQKRNYSPENVNELLDFTKRFAKFIYESIP